MEPALDLRDRSVGVVVLGCANRDGGPLCRLLFFQLLLGVTESVNWPAAMRVVARALPPEEQSLGNGIFTSGTSIGP